MEEDADELEMNFHRGANIVEWNHEFFFLTSEQYKLLSNLMEVFSKNQHAPLVMRSRDLTEFASTVLSQLSSFLDIEVNQEVQQTVFREELVAQCYIDTLDDQLLISPVFKYGELTIFPLKDQPIDEAMEKVVIDPDVRRFIAENRTVLDNEAIEKSASKLYEFVVEKKKAAAQSGQLMPGYKPSLSINNKRVDVTYEPSSDLINCLFPLFISRRKVPLP